MTKGDSYRIRGIWLITFVFTMNTEVRSINILQKKFGSDGGEADA